MKRVADIGGIFSTHLGFNTEEYGTNFEWRHTDEPIQKG